jgi:hypothetical protein
MKNAVCHMAKICQPEINIKDKNRLGDEMISCLTLIHFVM